MRIENSDTRAKRSKPLALSVPVPSEDLGYVILIGAGLLERVGSELRRIHPHAKRVALISDENVMPLYGDRVQASLESEQLEVHRLVVPPGESSKSAKQLVALVEEMVSSRLNRRDVVVALGGGVIGDLAGLAAAMFMRGIPLIQCPTTLLSQIDASVGGKVAVDLPCGKNIFGTFHFPSVVVVDPLALQTLDDRELGCGLAEMVKHGALFSQEHFDQIIESTDAVYSRDLDRLTRLVASSVAFKANCVSRDPLEHGEAGKGRILLNLGHTVGHAIEYMSDFQGKHGEAVALGLLAAARISDRKKLGAPGLEQLFRGALSSLRLPTDLDDWLQGNRGEAMIDVLNRDKKRGPTTISYIALRGIGDPVVLSLTGREIVNLLRGNTEQD